MSVPRSWWTMPPPKLSATVLFVSVSVPWLSMPPPVRSVSPPRTVRLVKVTLTPEPIRKIRDAGSVLRRRMTSPVPGTGDRERLLDHERVAAGRGPRERDGAGEAREEADLGGSDASSASRSVPNG
ncbi:MAG: hypothetical protein ABIY46_15795 [Gemmatimonadales bacterium]